MTPMALLNQWSNKPTTPEKIGIELDGTLWVEKL